MRAFVDVWSIDGECRIVDLAECERYDPTGHGFLSWKRSIVERRIVDIRPDGELIEGDVLVSVVSHLEGILTGRRTGHALAFRGGTPRIQKLCWHRRSDFWFIHARVDGLARQPDGYFELTRDEALDWMTANRRPSPYPALPATSEVEQAPASRRCKTNQSPDSTPAERRRGDPPKGNAGKALKEPTREAFAAYKLYKEHGKDQNTVARMLQEQLRKPVDQSKVSRWVSQVKNWIAAGHEWPDPKPRMIPVAPDRLDMGKRENNARRNS